MFPTEVCGLGARCLLRTFNFSHTGVSSLHSSCSSCFSKTIGQCSSEGVREQPSAPCGWLVRGLYVGDEPRAGDIQYCGLTSLMRKKQTSRICKWWEMHTRAHKAVCSSSTKGISVEVGSTVPQATRWQACTLLECPRAVHSILGSSRSAALRLIRSWPLTSLWRRPGDKRMSS